MNINLHFHIFSYDINININFKHTFKKKKEMLPILIVAVRQNLHDFICNLKQSNIDF